MDFLFGMQFETFNRGNEKKTWLTFANKSSLSLLQVLFVDQAVQFWQTITLHEE